MRINSLNFRIIKLIGGLVCITSIAILFSIWFSTKNHASSQLNRELEIGQGIFLDFIKNRESLLINSASVLTEDFGFKQAIATEDSGTIASMLNNHSERIAADIMAALTLDGTVIAQTSGLLLNEKSFQKINFSQLIAEGGISTFQWFNGKLYQTLFLTVDAPQPVAIAMIGFEVTTNLLEQIKTLTTLDVSIVVDQQPPLIISTLGANYQQNSPIFQLAMKQPQGIIETGKFSSKAFQLSQYENFDAVILLTQNTDILFRELNLLLKEVVVISLLAILLALLFGIVFSRHLSAPLEQLSTFAKRIAAGDYLSTISTDKGSSEIISLSKAFNHMQHNIAEREETIKYRADHDLLTGLYNRDYMVSILADKLQQPAPFQIIVLHISGFRELNETFGYSVGDSCLVKLAQFIQVWGGNAARIPGGEIIWLPKHPMDEIQLATLKKELEEKIFYSELAMKIKLLLGVVDSNEGFQSAEEIMRSISIVVSHARLNNAFIHHYHHQQKEIYLKRLEVLYALQDVLSREQNEFEMYYQPKLTLASYQVEKFEALIRWQSATLGFVSPELFIPIAERAGIIRELSQWVVKRVIRDLASWQLDVQVAINLSAQDIVSNELLNLVLVELEKNQLARHNLSFEITESDIMADPSEAIKQLKAFRSHGFSLAIDDFGTGQSSLSYIKDFPVAELKIDKSFVLKLDQQIDDQTIVKSIIALAKSFQLAVVAEGVENAASLKMLSNMGCDFIQGYFISKPIMASGVNTWLDNFHKTA